MPRPEKVSKVQKASSRRWHADSQMKYEAITERNRERLTEFYAVGSKSAWEKSYKPIRPRDLSVHLLNAFRVSVVTWVGKQLIDPEFFQQQVAQVAASALSDPSEPRAARAIESAIYEVRRITGLIDPARRLSYPLGKLEPDPQLSADEHLRIEGILREWLLDALAEFAH